MPRHTASGLAVLVVALAWGGVSRGADPTILYFEQRAADVRLSKAATREGEPGASQAYGTPLDVVSLRMEWEVPIRDEDLFRMAAFTNLEVLWFGYGRPSDQALAVLAGFPKLRELHISRCEPLGKLSWIAGLRELRDVQLQFCGLVDTHLEPLAGLDQLEVLLLDYNPLQGPGLRCLKGHKRLKYLGLWHTRVDGPSLRWLAECESLESIGAYLTRVDDAGLAHLASLKRLRSLDVRETLVGDAGVIAIADLPALKFVHFDGCHVGDEALLALARSSTVRSIGASRTWVTGKGLMALVRVKSLCAIEVIGTEIRSRDVERFQSIRPDVKITWYPWER